ncbi:HER230Cp [Eremothecium sinecaudum]|uniref:HER230Cp n=1 Tax=Eremothecium sinecaudum TaxID=45286 RepID=A0A109UZG9_9SACH|nr:HER230Cp [Eremothecium sinecaudum]AMD21508.1 HER230Cp [Eremothecium sinecaudum]
MSRNLLPLLNRRLSTFKAIGRPLNVLLFGSDQFSTHILRGLISLKKSQVLDRIQVVTRPAKKCGRNNQEMKEPAIVEYVQKSGLAEPIRCDSRSGLLQLHDKTHQFDVLLAVSFGLLIPSELISGVRWAFNVHPSLLPRYRGSSPIQYTLMNHDPVTGVTIQTLHPTRFDHGTVVAQTPELDTQELLNRGYCSNFDESVPVQYRSLMDQLGIQGSLLLNNHLQNNLIESKPLQPPYTPSKAPRITGELCNINWAKDTTATVLGKHHALGALYTFKSVQQKRSKSPMLRRVKFIEINSVEHEINGERLKPGSFTYDQDRNLLLIHLTDGVLSVSKILFQGYKQETADRFMTSFRKRCGLLLDQQFE